MKEKKVRNAWEQRILEKNVEREGEIDRQTDRQKDRNRDERKKCEGEERRKGFPE